MKSDFDWLIDRLAEEQRHRDQVTMRKAFAAEQERKQLERSLSFRRLQAEQEHILKAQRIAVRKAALETRNRFCTTLAKAHAVLRDDVMAGRVTALEAARGEAHLHRLAMLLPSQVGR